MERVDPPGPGKDHGFQGLGTGKTQRIRLEANVTRMVHQAGTHALPPAQFVPAVCAVGSSVQFGNSPILSTDDTGPAPVITDNNPAKRHTFGVSLIAYQNNRMPSKSDPCLRLRKRYSYRTSQSRQSRTDATYQMMSKHGMSKNSKPEIPLRGPVLPHPRFILFLAAFVLLSGMASLAVSIEQAVVLGFDLAVMIFIMASIPLWTADHPDAARNRAFRDDGGRVLLIATTALTIVSILLAVGRMIAERATLTVFDFSLVSGTLILAWVFFNLVYAFHYAHLFYDQTDGGDKKGIVFPEGEKPIFVDFVYFSFVIGMTCQTSDLVISSRHIRRTVTLHGLFAFFFNLGVLALAINVLAGVL